MSTTSAPAQAPGAPLAQGLDLLGDQWALLILQSVFLRIRRYNDLRARLGVADAVLAARLRGLVEAGVLAQEPYQDERRMRHEYMLTPRGLDLWQLLVVMWAWERRWIPGRDGDLPALRHLGCGATVPELACGRCGERVSATDTAVERPPDVPIAAAMPARRFRRQGWERVASDPMLFYPQTMEILGDRWATGILVAAFLAARRFADFQRELSIGPSVLTERLRRLIDLGVLATAPSTDRSGASEYRLTPKGRAFFPVFALLVAWASTHLDGEPGVRILHPACGHEFTPGLRCDRCGQALDRREVRFEL
jgi:DNA-binding HxlR family transcriptional regulator